MFSKVALFATSAFALAAVAAPTNPPTGGNSCNVGSLQCCNSVQNADNPTVQGIAGLLGIALSSITAQVGLTCNPISVIGVGGNSCSAQPVCCTNNNFSGLIALGCTPVNVNL